MKIISAILARNTRRFINQSESPFFPDLLILPSNRLSFRFQIEYSANKARRYQQFPNVLEARDCLRTCYYTSV